MSFSPTLVSGVLEDTGLKTPEPNVGDRKTCPHPELSYIGFPQEPGTLPWWPTVIFLDATMKESSKCRNEFQGNPLTCQEERLISWLTGGTEARSQQIMSLSGSWHVVDFPPPSPSILYLDPPKVYTKNTFGCPDNKIEGLHGGDKVKSPGT